MALLLEQVFCGLAVGIPTVAGEPIKLCPLFPHDELVQDLARRHGERTEGLGLTSGGQLVELLLSADGRTWTLIATNPRGEACVLAEGSDWRGAPRPQGPRT